MENSVFLQCVRYLWLRYIFLEEYLGRLSRSSQILNFCSWAWEKIKLIIRESFLGRISEVKEKEDFDRFTESVVIRRTAVLWRNLDRYFKDYFFQSRTYLLSKRILNNSRTFPLRAIGSIIIIAVSTAILMLICEEYAFRVSEMITYGLILFAGYAIYSCPADLKTLKSRSLFLRLILR